MARLDKVLKSVSSLDEEARKVILQELLKEEEVVEEPVQYEEPKQEEDEKVVAHTEQNERQKVMPEPKQEQTVPNGLEDVLTQMLEALKGLKEENTNLKQKVETVEKEKEEVVEKTPFGLNPKTPKKDGKDPVDFDVSDIYNQANRRY